MINEWPEDAPPMFGGFGGLTASVEWPPGHRGAVQSIGPFLAWTMGKNTIGVFVAAPSMIRALQETET